VQDWFVNYDEAGVFISWESLEVLQHFFFIPILNFGESTNERVTGANFHETKYYFML